jgi:F-type H+-transporting ATPase subunit epsilon
MADTFQFDLVSPESRLASGQAKAVRLPGADGDMTAMPDHAPTVTTLRPGTIVVEMEDGGEQKFVVLGGFAQITAESATVLADEAMRKTDVSSELLQQRIKEAQEAQAAKEGPDADVAAKLVADLEHLLQDMV